MRRFFFILTVSLLFFCGFSSPRDMAKVKMTGRVVYMGNEPFTYLVFCPNASKENYLIEDEKTVKVLSAHQGALLDVEGKIYESKSPFAQNGIKIKKWKHRSTKD